VQPKLLFRRAECDEEQLRTRPPDALDHWPVFLRIRFPADDGSVAAHHVHPEPLLQHAPGLFRDSLSAAEQIDPPAPRRRPLHQRKDQIGAGDPLGQGRSQEPRGPDQRLAVGEAEARRRVRLAEGRIAVHVDDVIDVGCEDRSASPRRHQRLDLVERFGKRQRVDPELPEPEAHARRGVAGLHRLERTTLAQRAFGH
jgi:hypothetical protein